MGFPLRAPGWLEDFRAFIARGNVIDLAVGVVIGAAFTGIVNSVVEDLLNPLIGALVGGIDFSQFYVVLSGQRGVSVGATREAGGVVLEIGKFVNAVVKFVIVAFAVFWLVRLVSRIYKPHEKEAALTRDQLLLQEIRDELKRGRGVVPEEGAPPAAPGR